MTSSSTTRCFGVVMISPWRVPALLLTAVILAWALAACGGGDSPDVEGGDAPRLESPETQATAMPEPTTRPQATTPPTETQATAMVGGRIAFSSGEWRTESAAFHIYVMNADGSGKTQLTENAASHDTPSWSPDGQCIAFASLQGGNVDIYVMNADGSDQTRLTEDSVPDRQPSWSPDGRRIAFASFRRANWNIYVMNADGSDQTRLTEDSASDSQPSWSPVGG